MVMRGVVYSGSGAPSGKEQRGRALKQHLLFNVIRRRVSMGIQTRPTVKSDSLPQDARLLFSIPAKDFSGNGRILFY